MLSSEGIEFSLPMVVLLLERLWSGAAGWSLTPPHRLLPALAGISCVLLPAPCRVALHPGSRPTPASFCGADRDRRPCCRYRGFRLDLRERVVALPSPLRNRDC